MIKGWYSYTPGRNLNQIVLFNFKFNKLVEKIIREVIKLRYPTPHQISAEFKLSTYQGVQLIQADHMRSGP